MANRSPFESFQWKSDIFHCESIDIESFYNLFAQEVTRLGMAEKKLGEVSKYSINLYQSPAAKSDLPSVLISAGFHGEESAGPWGMLHFLTEASANLFDRVNLSLLPMVNPTGFKRGHRVNKFGENPNRGFVFDCGKPTANTETSAEGHVLLAHAQLLLAASRDGILTCHEDVLSDHAYVYSFEPSQAPGRFSGELRDTLAGYFSISPESEIDACLVKQGIIFNHFDTSFEACLVRSGARVGACTETPAKQDFDQRLLANSALMTRFLALCAPERD